MEEDLDLAEEPSSSASYVRDAILASAGRIRDMMKPTGNKRKSSTTSPPSARKRRAVGGGGGGGLTGFEILGREKPPPKKREPPRKSKAAQPLPDDSLLPLRPAKLGNTFTATKRTASQAFAEMETGPQKKKTFTGSKRETLATLLGGETSPETNANPIGNGTGQLVMKRHSDTENFLPFDNEDSEDLFDTDDIYIEEFLETESALVAETSISSVKPSGSPDHTKLSPDHAILGSKTNQKYSPPPPMKPFIRSFTTLMSSSDASRDESMVSTFRRSPTCFRIAEALRFMSSTFFGGPTAIKTLNLEVYAYLHASFGPGQEVNITLADIFFPGKPPYLYATAQEATLALRIPNKGASSSSTVESLTGNLIHAVVQVIPGTLVSPSSPASIETTSSPTPARSPEKCTATALKIELTDWTEIQRVKDILDSVSETHNSSNANGASQIGKSSDALTSV
jgi:hypothetical protein